MVSTQEGYDRLAPRFDATPFRTPDDVLDAWSATWPAADRGLDLCCGTGAATTALRRHCAGEVVGLDFSSGMLGVARSRVPDVRFVQGDALDPPSLGTFDLVVSSGAFGHFRRPEQPALIASVRRLLRPGGAFCFVTSPPPPWWSAQAAVLRGFNLAMRARNRLHQPRFVMYYLNFQLPEARRLLEAAGFDVRQRALALARPTRLRAVEAVAPQVDER